MAKVRIKYPLGEAICPVCSNVFNRKRWWAQYCSLTCRRAWNASKPIRMAQNETDALCDRLQARVDELESEVSMLRSKLANLSGRPSAKPFKYDDEDQSKA